jgi:hypothetical protein
MDTEMGCPKCGWVIGRVLDRDYCRNDGTKLIPFDAKCDCGKPIDSYCSYIFSSKLFGGFHPEALGGKFCSKCGRNIKTQYEHYFKTWWKHHHNK